jgi:peptidoglycan/LPS O-acetylase OafA/YrhL
MPNDVVAFSEPMATPKPAEPGRRPAAAPLHAVAAGAVASPRAPSVKELPNLDVLRAIAVCLVLADHVAEAVTPHLGAVVHPWDWHLGRLGVLAFFVHTSFVLMQSLERSRYDGSAMFVSFYVRRLFRIYPLSVLCVAIVVAFHIPRVAWEGAPPAWSGLDIASNVLLTQNLTRSPSVLAPLWSLPYEVQMYVVLPFLFWFARRWSPLRVASIGCVIAVVAGVVQPSIPGLSRLDLAQYGPCFLAGVLAFALSKRVEPRLPSLAWTPFLLGLFVLYGMVAGRLETMHAPWLAWTFCLVLGTLLPHFRQVVFRPGRIVVHHIAKYSYGIYLSHMVALWIGFGGAPPHLVAGSFWFVGALVLFSVAGYHLVEWPLMQLGGRVSRRLCGEPRSGLERRSVTGGRPEDAGHGSAVSY